jgi:hypothetical protein
MAQTIFSAAHHQALVDGVRDLSRALLAADPATLPTGASDVVQGLRGLFSKLIDAEWVVLQRDPGACEADPGVIAAEEAIAARVVKLEDVARRAGTGLLPAR